MSESAELQKRIDLMAAELFIVMLNPEVTQSTAATEAMLLENASVIREINALCEKTEHCKLYGLGAFSGFMRRVLDEDLDPDNYLLASWNLLMSGVNGAPDAAHISLSINTLMPIVSRCLPAPDSETKPLH